MAPCIHHRISASPSRAPLDASTLRRCVRGCSDPLTPATPPAPIPALAPAPALLTNPVPPSAAVCAAPPSTFAVNTSALPPAFDSLSVTPASVPVTAPAALASAFALSGERPAGLVVSNTTRRACLAPGWSCRLCHSEGEPAGGEGVCTCGMGWDWNEQLMERRGSVRA